MHVSGSQLGEYRHALDILLSLHEFSDGFDKIKEKKKRGDSTESYRRVFNTFLPHFDMNISFIIGITHMFLSINICWAH